MPQGIYVRTVEHKRNLGNALKGKRRTPEQRQRMGEARKGKPSEKKGKHFPQYQGANAAHWKGGRPHCVTCGKPITYGAIYCKEHYTGVDHKTQPCGANHPKWKGDNVHTETLHQWIRKNKPKPELCECCHQKTPYDCANISGQYLRDVNDYEWLCRRCHMLKDGRLETIRIRASHTWELHKAKL